MVEPTPLKNMKVNWDYYSQYMEKNVPNHQPDEYSMFFHVESILSLDPRYNFPCWTNIQVLSIFYASTLNFSIPTSMPSGTSTPMSSWGEIQRRGCFWSHSKHCVFSKKMGLTRNNMNKHGLKKQTHGKILQHHKIQWIGLLGRDSYWETMVFELPNSSTNPLFPQLDSLNFF